MSENTYIGRVPESVCHPDPFNSVYWLKEKADRMVKSFEKKVFLDPLEDALGEVVSLVGRVCWNQVEPFSRHPMCYPEWGDLGTLGRSSLWLGFPETPEGSQCSPLSISSLRKEELMGRGPK